MNRDVLLARGVELMAEFCAANKLVVPEVREVPRTGFAACAYYRPTSITIAPAQCATIGRAGRAWSYPGYMIDRTPLGVIAHELGHHVDYWSSNQRASFFGDYGTAMRKASGEPKLTGYCPNDAEWFAEMFRLFVTNSDLLKGVRPRIHTELRYRFRPVVDAPWREVLKDAPDRTIEMAERRVSETSGRLL